MVYARDLGDKRLEFGALGAENGVLVLYDRPTHSRWSQVAGRAVAGPLSGSRLRKLPSLVTTWARWRTLHPDTSVYVDEEPPARRPRFNEETVSQVALGVEGPVRYEDWVLGLEGRTGSKAFLVRRLVEARVLRFGERNQLDQLDSEGAVHVTQPPARPKLTLPPGHPRL